MAGALDAATQSPITSAIILMEMVDGHAMVNSLMATALLAKAISERLGPELYQELAYNFTRTLSRNRNPKWGEYSGQGLARHGQES